MNPLENIITAQGTLILDGALATELEARGCDLNDSLWSAKILMEKPEIIRQIHLDYFAAGADCAITASYQATFEGFARRGLNHAQAETLIRRAVDLAVEARDDFWSDERNRLGRVKPIVAASVGSYGAYLADGSEYRGDYGLTESKLIDFHRPRLAVLSDTPADIIAFETVPCLLEAQALAHILTEFPNRFAWLSFSAKDESHICHGESLAECAAWLNNFSQIVAIGINCTEPRFVPALIESAREHTDKPILAYPNSGEAYSVENKSWYGESDHATYGEQSQHWHTLGATIIGGCCRTTPADIAQIAKWVRAK